MFPHPIILISTLLFGITKDIGVSEPHSGGKDINTRTNALESRWEINLRKPGGSETV